VAVVTAVLPVPAAGEPDSDEPAADNPLTTKEGWRRFVDTEPSPPVLLDATALASLDAAQRAGYDEARIDYHVGLPLLNTRVIRQVISTSRLMIQLNRHQVSARRGVVISGASGTGKTTALSQLGRAHELAARKRHPADRHRLPVVYITVPPAATPRMVAVEFARFFGLPAPRSANLTDVTNAVCATAARTSVDLVLVDEIHNISLATRTGAEVSDTLKYFAERLPATFVYAGLDVDETGLFAGSLPQLVRGAAILAIGDGTEQITRDLLDLVPVDHAAQRSGIRLASRKARART
jgi:AAA domain